MDSAEAERLSEILRTQEARLSRQEEFQTAMAANMGQITLQMQDLLGQLSRPNPAPPTPPTSSTPGSTGSLRRCRLQTSTADPIHR